MSAAMAKEKPSFRELLEAAAKPYRTLWNVNGVLNLRALSKHYSQRGYPLTAASLSRLCSGKQSPERKAVEATHRVFGIPRGLLRGEPFSAEMREMLTDYKMSTLLLAQRIEALSKDDYYQVSELVAHLEGKAEQLRRAVERSPNVTALEHKRRS